MLQPQQQSAFMLAKVRKAFSRNQWLHIRQEDPADDLLMLLSEVFPAKYLRRATLLHMDRFVFVRIRALGLVAIELDVARIEFVNSADGTKHLALEVYEMRSRRNYGILPWLC